MKKTNIEVEGGELLLQSAEGHYAVIPAKHRREVQDMIDSGCQDCLNSYIKNLPKEKDYAQDGTVITKDGKIERPKLPLFELPETEVVGEKPAWMKYKEEAENKFEPFDGNPYLEKYKPKRYEKAVNLYNKSKSNYVKEQVAKSIMQDNPYNKKEGVDKYLKSLNPKEVEYVTDSKIFNKSSKSGFDYLDQALVGASPLNVGIKNKQFTAEEAKNSDTVSNMLNAVGLAGSKPLQGVSNKLGITNFKNPDGSKYTIRDAINLKENNASMFADGVSDISNFTGVGFAKYLPKFNKALKSTASLAEEIAGEILHSKANRNAIKEGNNWLNDWIQNPFTQEKITNDLVNQKDIVQKYHNYPDKIIEELDLLEKQSKNFSPSSAEYSLLSQISENLDNYTMPSNLNQPNIHLGNWGVSYRHNDSPLMRAIVDNTTVTQNNITKPWKPFKHYGSWISRTPFMKSANRTSTVIHEGTHDWTTDRALRATGMRNIMLKNTNSDIRTLTEKWNTLRELGLDPKLIMGVENATLGYLGNPTEIHARIMELRHALKLTPSDNITIENAEDIIKMIEDGKTPVTPKFLKVIDKNPKSLAELFNRLWALPLIAIGVNTLNNNENKEQ